MSKKFLTVVAGMSLCAPLCSFAETANVNVYGMLNISAESVSANGPTTGQSAYIGRNRVQANSSNFGVKGSEDLGDGYKAVFQVETGVDVAMNQSTSYTTNTTNYMILRNTGVGLVTPMGQVMFGHWDTPFKSATMFMEPFYGTSSGTLSNLIDSISGQGGNANVPSSGGSKAQTFHRRQGNSIQYWSPNMNGLTVKAMYSANVDRDSTAPLAGTNPDLLSASLGYEGNGMNAVVVYEQHDDFRSAAGAIPTKDTGIKAAAGYTFGSTQAGVVFSTISQKDGDAAAKSRSAFGASVIHRMSNWALRLGMTKAGEWTDAVNTGAMNGMFGVSYSFSKRTDVYGEFARIWNQDAASYNYQYNPVGTFGAGADPQTVAIGFRHTF